MTNREYLIQLKADLHKQMIVATDMMVEFNKMESQIIEILALEKRLVVTDLDDEIPA